MRSAFASLTVVLTFASGAALAQDAGWAGGYGGVSMATNSGSHEYSDGDRYDLEGPAFGAFGGYMWANGNLVYGAEAAITLGGVYEVTTDGSTSYKDDYEYDRFYDLKGRVGYAMNDVLLYGTLGVSRTEFNANILSGPEVSTSDTGVVYGIGADYKFDDRFFAGAEFLRREYDFYEADQDVDIESKINTFTLRVGMKF